MMEKFNALMGRLFFGLVILIALVTVLSGARLDFEQGDWFGVAISILLAIAMAYDYWTDWRYKIK